MNETRCAYCPGVGDFWTGATKDDFFGEWVCSTHLSDFKTVAQQVEAQPIEGKHYKNRREYRRYGGIAIRRKKLW